MYDGENMTDKQKQQTEEQNTEESLHIDEANEQQNGVETAPGTDNHEQTADEPTTVEGEVVEVVADETGSSESADDMMQRLNEAEKQIEQFKDQWMRSVAEFKNYKRRTETERSDLIRNASASLVLKLLPIIDDFERASASVPEEIASHPWWEGTRLIEQKLRTVLESEGVTPIEAEGTDFDPNVHEAVLYEEAEGQEGKVTAELQKGYRMHDRVLRPSMVKVGKG
jgi:molecular chaperone GrpE